MLRIAIVEDDRIAAENIENYLHDYCRDYKTMFHIDKFTDAVNFLEEFDSNYDLILFDIEMPYINGIEAAKRIREKDKRAVIVFITNMKQYALDGYAVNAVDYLIKPVKYSRFCSMMNKAIAVLSFWGDEYVLIPAIGEQRRVRVQDILYVQIKTHWIKYYLVGEVFDSWGNLSTEEKLFPKELFARCNSSTLVNLSAVTAVKNDIVTVGNVDLHVSRTGKRKFMEAFYRYMGKN